MKNKLIKSAKDKSKMKYYFDGKKEWKIGKRAKYMDKLTRNQVSTIFKARTRMLKVKGNYKNACTNLNCRLCNDKEETQTHILEECKCLNEKEKIITKQMIFNEDVEQLKSTTKAIERRIEIMKNIMNNHVQN